jgi:hypothetical protein
MATFPISNDLINLDLFPSGECPALPTQGQVWPQGLFFGSYAGASAVTNINVSAITYSQSTVYPGNSAATNAGMTNGVTAESVQTATLPSVNEYVRMDLGAEYPVATIYVGCDFTNTLAGGWGKVYTENHIMEYSTDGTNWTYIGSTGTFSSALKTFSVSFNARYIQLHSQEGNGYIVVTEFYATST